MMMFGSVESLLVAGLLLQAPSPQSNPQRPSPFRTEAELVAVDAVVSGEDGRPVPGLAASDFSITEDGRTRTIELFQPVTAGGPSGREPGSAARRFRYSTNVGAEARPVRSFVLFFDDVHLTQEQGERAKRALETFLQDEASDGDVVSLIAPGRGLRWHARLPAGAGELRQALAALQGSRIPDVTRERISDYEAYRIHVMNDEQMAERVGRRFSNFQVAGRDPVNLQRDEGPRPEKKGGTAGLIEPFVHFRAAEAYARTTARSRLTLGALTRTIESMAAARGRKSIVIMSPGFVLDQELPLFREAEDAARRANVAIYFVDARGLEVQSVFGSAELGVPLDSRDVGAANADLALEAEGAASLAESSGGFSVRNRNDLAAGLRRIAQESRIYYLLGYRPAGKADGKFRRIAVRVNRPGVQVRARRGYYAGGVRAANGVAEDALKTALDSPYDTGTLPVRTAAYAFGPVDGGNVSVMLAVEADLRAFEIKRDGAFLTDVLDLHLLVTDAATGEAKRSERSIEMKLQTGVPAAETSAWYPLSEAFHLKPGRYQARIAIRDRNSSRIGAVTHDFEVPRQEGMRLSSVIVTDTVEEPPLFSTAPPRPVLIVRRLLTGTIYYQFSVYDAGRTTGGDTRVTAGHVVRRPDGTVVKELKPSLLVPGSSGMSRFARVSLGGIPPGDYELVITVSDALRGETVTVTEPFVIAQQFQQKTF